MLRWLVLVLLLANAGYLAWSQHWLTGLGLAPATESEPGRLRQQIEPEALTLLPGQGSKNSKVDSDGSANGKGKANPGAAASDAAVVASAAAVVTASPDAAAPAAEAPAASDAPGQVAALPASPSDAVVVSAAGAPAAAGLTAVPTAAERGECLQAGPFDTAEAERWRRAASVLPPGSWSLQRSTTPGRWMVYSGRLADADALAKKRAELRARNISFDRTGVTALEPGLSLGRFSTEEAAERALSMLNRKNSDAVRNARVVVEREETVSFQLRLPLVDSALRAQLGTLRPALAGNALVSCF